MPLNYSDAAWGSGVGWHAAMQSYEFRTQRVLVPVDSMVRTLRRLEHHNPQTMARDPGGTAIAMFNVFPSIWTRDNAK